MFDFLFKIWYLIAILPFFIFLEASEKFAKLLKDRNVYEHWDAWHSALVFFVVLLVILWLDGFRP